MPYTIRPGDRIEVALGEKATEGEYLDADDLEFGDTTLMGTPSIALVAGPAIRLRSVDTGETVLVPVEKITGIVLRDV